MRVPPFAVHDRLCRRGVHIPPPERLHLAPPQSRVSAQQDHHPVGRVVGGLEELLEGECDALALAICGYGGLVRSVGGAGNLRLATVTDREQRAMVLVADGDPKGRAAAWKLHDEIAAVGPERKPRVHEFETGDPAELLAELLGPSVTSKAGVPLRGYGPAGPDWAELLAAAARGDDLLNFSCPTLGQRT